MLTMHEKLSPAAWDQLILDLDYALAAIDDQAERARAIERLMAQYLPAALRARGDAASTRVWTALAHYLTARPAPRKAWSLSHTQAE